MKGSGLEGLKVCRPQQMISPPSPAAAAVAAPSRADTDWGRLASSISTHATRSGLRWRLPQEVSGWLTTASSRLLDGEYTGRLDGVTVYT